MKCTVNWKSWKRFSRKIENSLLKYLNGIWVLVLTYYYTAIYNPRRTIAVILMLCPIDFVSIAEYFVMAFQFL